MKAYTDFEQSKILKDILPIESADMFWYRDAVTTEVNPRIMNYTQVPKLQSMYYSPCWSLAALLSVLPKEVRLVGSTKDHYWYCECIDAHDSNWYAGFESSDNPVDACVEMIAKLHEQKLL